MEFDLKLQAQHTCLIMVLQSVPLLEVSWSGKIFRFLVHYSLFGSWKLQETPALGTQETYYFLGPSYGIEKKQLYLEGWSEKAILYWERFRHQSHSFCIFETSQLFHCSKREIISTRTTKRVKIIFLVKKVTWPSFPTAFISARTAALALGSLHNCSKSSNCINTTQD